MPTAGRAQPGFTDLTYGRGVSTVPELTSDQLSAEFPGNEWLVADIYDKYRTDKSSVDAQWVAIFERLESGRSADDGQGAPAQGGQATETVTDAPKDPGEASDSGKPTPQEPASTKDTTKDAESKDSAKARQESSASSSAPASTKGTGQGKETAKAATPKPTVKRSGAPSTAPVPSEPTKATKKDSAASGEDKVTPLRGIAKAVAKNMDASLSMPTATTVRDVPAKALIDNRVIINNHLRRSRGGKVSFTHLIGYAIVRALAQFPSMNVLYREDDGKPVMVEPAHVNFGLALSLIHI